MHLSSGSTVSMSGMVKWEAFAAAVALGEVHANEIVRVTGHATVIDFVCEHGVRGSCCMRHAWCETPFALV